MQLRNYQKQVSFEQQFIDLDILPVFMQALKRVGFFSFFLPKLISKSVKFRHVIPVIYCSILISTQVFFVLFLQCDLLGPVKRANIN